MLVGESVANRDEFFLLELLLDRYKEEIRSVVSDRLKGTEAHFLIVNNNRQSLKQTEDLLEPKMTSSLIDMSRLEQKQKRI